MHERKSPDDFLADEANIINDNDIILDVASYYNGDELEWIIRLFMNILFYFMKEATLPWIGFQQC